jgi:hypothetical protein
MEAIDRRTCLFFPHFETFKEKYSFTKGYNINLTNISVYGLSDCNFSVKNNDLIKIDFEIKYIDGEYTLYPLKKYEYYLVKYSRYVENINTIGHKYTNFSPNVRKLSDKEILELNTKTVTEVLKTGHSIQTKYCDDDRILMEIFYLGDEDE